MRYRLIIPMVFFILIIAVSGFYVNDIVEAGPVAQQPTGNIPTVTSTPRGPYVIVNALTANDTQINVRAGPSALTEKVGVLLIDQEANAIGRYGDWIQIEYVGAADGKAWVYGNLVTLFGGNLPIVEPPPTPTPIIVGGHGLAPALKTASMTALLTALIPSPGGGICSTATASEPPPLGTTVNSNVSPSVNSQCMNGTYLPVLSPGFLPVNGFTVFGLSGTSLVALLTAFTNAFSITLSPGKS